MVAKLRSCCRIAVPVGRSAAWLTSEAPARMATPRATQRGTLQRGSRRSREDTIDGSHDSTAYGARRETAGALCYHSDTLAAEGRERAQEELCARVPWHTVWL